MDAIDIGRFNAPAEAPVLTVPNFDRRCRFHPNRPFVAIVRSGRRVALFCIECDRVDAERITRQAGQSWAGR